MLNHTYDAPVAALLSYGECKADTAKDWPNYRQELELTAEHIPSLIQMTQDEQLWELFTDNFDHEDEFIDAGLDPEQALWAPIHAWRALGQLQAVEAVKPLAQVLHQHPIDWCWEELPQVLALIGAEAIDPLDELLLAPMDYNCKITLAAGLGAIVQASPGLRDRGVEVLTWQLSHYKTHHRTLNGELISELMDLEAVESVAVMAAAYQAKKVDEMFVGSWPRVQVDLGLKQESDFTPEELSIHYTPEQEQSLANVQAYLDRQKLSALELGLPMRRSAFEFEKPAEFKDFAAQVGPKKLADKAGFGSGAKSGSKKSKKKKK